MNIYFACSITGGREFQPVYQSIVLALLQQGHTIPTAHLADAVVVSETILSPHEVYDRDTRWLHGCDLLLAEVSVPSHGVGYEIAYALALGRPVLCIYREDRHVSKMITGNPDPLLRVSTYCTETEAINKITGFIAGL